MRPAERTSTAVKPKTLLARQVTLTWFHIINFLLPPQNIHLRLLSLRNEVNILRIFGWLNRHLAIRQTGQLDWNLVIKNTMAHFWLTHFCEECRLRKWLIVSELSWKSVSIQLHTSWIVGGNYIYQKFSCTEACVSKMKTTALCVLALFLSPMLVEGSAINYPCHGRGNCNGEKVHE